MVSYYWPIVTLSVTLTIFLDIPLQKCLDLETLLGVIQGH